MKLICAGCHLPRNKFYAAKGNGEVYCVKCCRRGAVDSRPKGMNWRLAFHNLMKHGTYHPEEIKKNVVAPPPLFASKEVTLN